MTFPFSTFFTQAGKAFFAGNTANTAIGTTIRDEAEDFTQQFGSSSLEVQDAVSGAPKAVDALKNAGKSFNQTLVYTPVRNLLVQLVKEDNPQPDTKVSTAVTELIRQMIAENESVDASSPGSSVSYGASNTGTGKIYVSTKRGDGRVNEHILAEDIEVSVTSTSANDEATLRFVGEEKLDLLHPNWPEGSGASLTITSYNGDSAANLVTGTFETAETNQSSLPSGWVASVGTLGTTIKLTNVEVQTVVMSGTPTSGYYTLTFTNKDSESQTTGPLAYNATSTDVQTALRLLTGLESITVAQTGTAPNYTHTITFTGVPNPGQLTSTDVTDSGSIAHNTTTAGSANVIRGARSLELDSNGSELSTLNYKVSLSATTGYRFNAWMLADVVPAAGVITVDLVDGIGGSVITDDEGTSNSFTVDCTGLTTSFTAQSGSFRTPTVLPPNVYLRIRISTAVSSGTSIFIDEVCFVPESEFYAGGPFLSAFTGPVAWETSDVATVTTTNDRAGALHEWCNRVFRLSDNRQLLYSNASGSETIADSLIS